MGDKIKNALKYILLLHLCTFGFSQWAENSDNPLDLGSGIQPQVSATSDGGVYVAWLTSSGYHVYLQRLDSQGVPQFSDGGMLISDNSNASWIAVFHLNLTVDSDDNAIVSFVDQRTGSWNVYAYKIGTDGTMEWGGDGIALSSSGVDSISPRLVCLNDDSVLVTWSENYSSVHMQRISVEGVLLWGEGVQINSFSESLMSPQPIMSDTGDIFVQWIGQSGQVWAADSKIYLQKYNYDGSTVWNSPSVVVGPVVFPMGNWLQQSIPDGQSGSFAAWTQMSGNVQKAVAQHIDNEGQLSWDGGIELSANSSTFRMSPRLVIGSEPNGLMAAWNQSNSAQSQRGIYAQRFDDTGSRLWGPGGAAVVPMGSSYDYLDLTVASIDEGMIAAYIQQSTNMSGDIYAKMLDLNGEIQWTADITSSGQSKSDLASVKIDGAMVLTWSEDGDIYAHCLRDDGTLGPPDNNILGDVNGDGSVSILDLVIIVNMIITSEYSPIADSNDDGIINILDIVNLINIILGN